MDELRRAGVSFESIGIFDAPLGLPALVFRLLFGRVELILSSNLKANIFCMAFLRVPKVVILNGMGRFRRKKLVRWLLLFLLRLQRDVRLIAQNYADYRYLKRYSSRLRLFWLPGSGGTVKEIGNQDVAVVVQRDSKIGRVAKDVRALLNEKKNLADLLIVGCENQEQLITLFPEKKWRSVGYVESTKIFIGAGIFLQPTGYGEGFPHTLADALVSGMEVWISNIEYLRCGLGRLGADREPVAPGWSRVIVSENLLKSVGSQSIARATYGICSAGQHAALCPTRSM